MPTDNVSERSNRTSARISVSCLIADTPIGGCQGGAEGPSSDRRHGRSRHHVSRSRFSPGPGARRDGTAGCRCLRRSDRPLRHFPVDRRARFSTLPEPEPPAHRFRGCARTGPEVCHAPNSSPPSDAEQRSGGTPRLPPGSNLAQDATSRPDGASTLRRANRSHTDTAQYPAGRRGRTHVAAARQNCRLEINPVGEPRDRATAALAAPPPGRRSTAPRGAAGSGGTAGSIRPASDDPGPDGPGPADAEAPAASVKPVESRTASFSPLLPHTFADTRIEEARVDESTAPTRADGGAR